jgi:hypothetical protein
MTQKEIQERNKEIALMLGWNIVSFPTSMSTPFHGRSIWFKNDSEKSGQSVCEVGEEYFHKSWDWLMEAVEFIKSINAVFWFPDSFCIKEDRTISSKTIVQTHFKLPKEEKEAVFIAVSNFAKLYNEKKL